MQIFGKLRVFSTAKLLLPVLLTLGGLSVEAQAQARFVKESSPLQQGKWVNDAKALCQVAEETLLYLNKGPAYDPSAIHGGKVAGATFPLTRVKDTLNFICQTAKKNPALLSDAKFIRDNFEMIRWYPDVAGAHKIAKEKPLLANIPQDQILQTKYYVRIADGSPTKTAKQPQALYGLPYDEAQLKLAEADALGSKITRFQLGKQAIVNGALEQKPLRAPALVWLSREDLEGALLQGTAVIPNGNAYRYFNVHRTNGIPYNRKIAPEQQERYWYFKEVKSVLGYGKDADYKIPIQPQVTVAGDIPQLGLGKLILLATKEHGNITYRLTVLADTGGAFANNLYQLDWLSGYYRGWDDYYAANKHRGDYSNSWILVKKLQK